MNLSERIQSLRKARGLSQEELAEQIGVSRQAVGKWESAQSQPDLDKILLLSEYFGVSCDYLLTGREPEPQPSQGVPLPRDLKVVGTIATVVNLVALILACALWRQYQTPLCTALPFIGFVLGTGFFLIVSHGLEPALPAPELRRVRYGFWARNVWIIALPVVSLFQEFPWSFGYTAPYPLLHIGRYFGPSFCICIAVYLAVCIAVTLFCRSKRNR